MQYVQLRTEKALNARLGQGTGMVRFSSSEKLDPSLPVYREHFSGRLLIDTSVPLFHMTEIFFRIIMAVESYPDIPREFVGCAPGTGHKVLATRLLSRPTPPSRKSELPEAWVNCEPELAELLDRCFPQENWPPQLRVLGLPPPSVVARPTSPNSLSRPT